MLNDVQTPFLGTPLVPLELAWLSRPFRPFRPFPVSPLRRFAVLALRSFHCVSRFPSCRFSCTGFTSEVGKLGWINGVPAKCPYIRHKIYQLVLNCIKMNVVLDLRAIYGHFAGAPFIQPCLASVKLSFQQPTLQTSTTHHCFFSCAYLFRFPDSFDTLRIHSTIITGLCACM